MHLRATTFIAPNTEYRVFDTPDRRGGGGRVIGLEWDDLTVHVADHLDNDEDVIVSASLLIAALEEIRQAARDRMSDIPMIHPIDISDPEAVMLAYQSGDLR